MPTTDLIIKYDDMKAYLAKQEKIDPERTHTIFDLLLEHIDNACVWVINGNDKKGRSVAVTLDHESKKISIFGDELLIKEKCVFPLAYMKILPIHEQIYTLFNMAYEEAKKTHQSFIYSL